MRFDFINLLCVFRTKVWFLQAFQSLMNVVKGHMSVSLHVIDTLLICYRPLLQSSPEIKTSQNL